MAKKILIGLLVIFILMQFIRPTRNESTAMSPNDIEKHYETPENVKLILSKACRDCHSNNTVYPWYAQFQPGAWFMNDHIVDGKRHFNLSEFAAYEPKKADHKLDEFSEEIEEHGMPLESYLWLHTDAKLTDIEIKEVTDWAKGIRKEIQTKNPQAFLKKDKE
jgi:hypothetical protein